MTTWEKEARQVLRGELARAGCSIKSLTAKLGAIGIEELPSNVSNKISRGKFTFAFFMQCMHCIGVARVHVDVDEVPQPPKRRKRAAPKAKKADGQVEPKTASKAKKKDSGKASS